VSKLLGFGSMILGKSIPSNSKNIILFPFNKHNEVNVVKNDLNTQIDNSIILAVTILTKVYDR
jgi:hypothetical protein